MPELEKNIMNNRELFYIFHDFKKMPLTILKEWLDFAYRWHDEQYIKKIKIEFKRRGISYV